MIDRKNCIFGVLLTYLAYVTHSVLHLNQVIVANFLRKFDHFLFECGNEVLWVGALSSDELHNALQVNGVQCCIYLVKHVEDCRLTFLKRHQHTKSKNTLLSPWKLVPPSWNFSFCFKRDQNGHGSSEFASIWTEMTRFFVSFKPDIGLATSDSCENSREVPLKLVEYLGNLLIFVSLALIYHFIQVFFHFKHILIVFPFLFIFLAILTEFAKQKFLLSSVEMPWLAMCSRKAHTEWVWTLLDLFKFGLNRPYFVKLCLVVRELFICKAKLCQNAFNSNLPFRNVLTNRKDFFLQIQSPCLSVLQTLLKPRAILSFIDIIWAERFIEVDLLFHLYYLLSQCLLFSGQNCQFLLDIVLFLSA